MPKNIKSPYRCAAALLHDAHLAYLVEQDPHGRISVELLHVVGQLVDAVPFRQVPDQLLRAGQRDRQLVCQPSPAV